MGGLSLAFADIIITRLPLLGAFVSSFPPSYPQPLRRAFHRAFFLLGWLVGYLALSATWEWSRFMLIPFVCLVPPPPLEPWNGATADGSEEQEAPSSVAQGRGKKSRIKFLIIR